MDQEPQITRRLLFAGGLAAAGTLAHAAPSIANEKPWVAYEERLRARLSDAAGGRFDLPTAREVLNLTNAARRRAGASRLVWHEGLARTASAHAADLAGRGYVEHLSPEGFDPSHRFWLLDRRTIGSPSENIGYRRASTPATAGELMDAWRGSPPHWRNLLAKKHTHAGFGLVRLGDRAYVVGLYAQPSLTLPAAFPFRPTPESFGSAWRTIPRELGVGVSTVQGGGWSGADGAARVMQLSHERRIDAKASVLIGGPIYVEPSYGRAG